MDSTTAPPTPQSDSPLNESWNQPPNSPNPVFYNKQGIRSGWRILLYVCLTLLLYGIELVPVSLLLRAQNPYKVSTIILGEAMVFLAAFGAALLVPWRVTVQAAPSNPSPPSRVPAPRHPEQSSAERRRQEQRLAAERDRLLFLKREFSAVSERNRLLQTEIARQAAMLAALRAQQDAHHRQLAELAAQKQVLLHHAAHQNQLLVLEQTRLNEVLAEQRALLLRRAAVSEGRAG